MYLTFSASQRVLAFPKRKGEGRSALHVPSDDSRAVESKA